MSMPGLIVALGRGEHQLQCRRSEFIEELLRANYGRPVKPFCRVELGDHLVAYGVTARPSANNYYRGDDGISVVLDGYLLDMARPFAETIATAYRRQGSSPFAAAIKGSFTGLVVDRRLGQALLFNDRQGSRPLYCRELGKDAYVFAPQVKLLASLSPAAQALNDAAVAQFLIRGCFYGDATLYEGVRKVPQASLGKLTADDVQWGRYWSFQFKHHDLQRSEAELLEEFDALLLQSTQRLLRVVTNPLLLLSGGIDSRLMLAYLVKAGANSMPCLSYMVRASNGDDHLVAKHLAELCRLPHDTYEIDERDFPHIARKEVLAADGRVQVLDAPSNRWEHIAARHQSIFIGDECFGWKEPVTSVAEALHTVGWYNLDQTPRIADWFRPAARRNVFRQISMIQQRLAAEAGEIVPDNIKDKLYYTERMGNMLNGFGARRLWLLEQARPLLDEDVIEFITRLPPDKRHNKVLAWKLMQAKHPLLHAVPYAKRTSVPWMPPQFTQITSRNSQLYDFVVSTLVDKLHPRLAEILDAKRLKATIPALFGGQRLPSMRGEWWTRMPGLWRFSRERHDKVGAVRGALRLLGLNLYLSS